jgi:hypothetical protein
MIGALAFGWARYAAELAEINHNHPGLSGKEKTKDQALLQHIGIEAKVRESIAIATEKEKQQWLQEIRGNNMDWEYPDKKRAARGGWQLGLGFMAGGILTALLRGQYPKDIPAFTRPGFPPCLRHYCFRPGRIHRQKL